MIPPLKLHEDGPGACGFWGTIEFAKNWQKLENQERNE